MNTSQCQLCVLELERYTDAKSYALIIIQYYHNDMDVNGK